jgi:hypothetical protein
MGFEPTVRCRTHAFQAGALNHSATLPHAFHKATASWLIPYLLAYANGHSATLPHAFHKATASWFIPCLLAYANGHSATLPHVFVIPA